MQRRWARSAVMVLAMSGVSGCAPTTPTLHAPLRIAHELWAGYYPLDAIAADSASPLRLETRVVESSDRLFAEFAAGTYDGIAASVVDLLRLQQTATDLRIVGCTDESAGADAIVARGGVQSAASLAGKRVGVSLGTFSEMLVDEMLRRAGLARSDVTLLDVDGQSVPAQLRAGRIDAGQTWEPYLSQLPADSFPVLFTTRDTPRLVLQCLAFHDRVIRADPARIRALINAIGQQGDTLVRTPGLIRERAARAVGRPVDDMPSIFGVHWLSLEENRRLLGTNEHVGELATITEPHLRFLAATGALRARPDLNTIVRADLLPTSARPTP